MKIAVLGVLCGIISMPAAADTMKWCLQTPIALVDNGFADQDGTTEDNWNTDTNQVLRGHYATVLDNSTSALLWTGYLDDGFGPDGAGCTSAFFVANNMITYKITITSKAYVQSNYIQGWAEGSMQSMVVTPNVACCGAPNNHSVTLSVSPATGDPSDAFRMSMIGAFALFRHAGGLTGKTYKIHTRSGYSSQYNFYASQVEIDPSHVSRKFVVTHELGHNLSNEASSFDSINEDTSQNGTGRCSTGGSHALNSKEYAKAAFVEGFADFFSTDVWNSHSEQTAILRYWGSDVSICSTSGGLPVIVTSRPTVDMEVAGSTDATNPPFTTATTATQCPAATVESYPLKYMETLCSGTWTDRGTEVDWARTFWDMHSNATNPAAMNDIFAWLGDAWAWPNVSTTFVEMDDAANRVGGDVNARWDSFKTTNGIDH